MKELNQKYKALFAKLEQIPPSQIMERMGFPQRKIKWIGANHAKCLCPFPGHQDETVGSFDLNDDKKIAKCFACQQGGRPIRFFRDLCGLTSDFEAGILMAEVFGYITHGDVQTILRSKENNFQIKENTESYTKSKQPEEPPMQNITVRSTFYEVFTNQLGLNNEDKDYLLSRGVKEDELEDFFSYPSTFKDLMAVFHKTQEILGWEAKQYIGIPGLFRCNPEDKESYVRPVLRNNQCIGIKIRNVDGLIAGLQFRNYKESPSGKRYFWLSSSYVNSPKYPLFSHGCSSTAPAGFQPARGEIIYPAIVITEGKFKALALAKLGLNVFTIQGVGNWNAGIEEIKHFLKINPEQKRIIYMAFDADQKTNPAVASAVKKFYEHLLELDFQVRVLDWDINQGKGIDDALLAGAKIRKYKADAYINKFVLPMIKNQKKLCQQRKEQLQDLMRIKK